MSDVFSTQRNRNKSLIFLVICGVLASTAVILGIDDNPPGILLALLAAAAFILACVHPWRTARKFLFLLLASVLGIVLFIILNIISDSITQNPASSSTLKNLIENPVNDALNIIFTMLVLAAFIIGIVGSITMFIRNRRQAMTAH